MALLGCCYSVTKLYSDCMDHSPPGSSVLHNYPEFISSSATPFSFCLQSFPASGSFPVSPLFSSGGQSVGASATVLPMNIQGWFPLGLTSLISLQSKGLSWVFSSTTFESINSLVLSLLYGPTLTSIYDYWKNHSFDYMHLCWQSDVSAF